MKRLAGLVLAVVTALNAQAQPPEWYAKFAAAQERLTQAQADPSNSKDKFLENANALSDILWEGYGYAKKSGYSAEFDEIIDAQTNLVAALDAYQKKTGRPGDKVYAGVLAEGLISLSRSIDADLAQYTAEHAAEVDYNKSIGKLHTAIRNKDSLGVRSGLDECLQLFTDPIRGDHLLKVYFHDFARDTNTIQQAKQLAWPAEDRGKFDTEKSVADYNAACRQAVQRYHELTDHAK